MNDPKYQIHLTGPGFSGRAVRYKLLDIDVIDHIECMVAEMPEAKAGMTAIKYNKLVSREAVALMLVAMTDPVSPDKLPEATWQATSPGQWATDPSGAGGLKTCFTPKDIDLLRSVYSEAHAVGKAEADRILSGKVAISG